MIRYLLVEIVKVFGFFAKEKELIALEHHLLQRIRKSGVICPLTEDDLQGDLFEQFLKIVPRL